VQAADEDGVKHCAMNVLCGLQHLGYTIPPHGNQRSAWDAGAGFDFKNPEYR
jgi:hypothetical protein